MACHHCDLMQRVPPGPQGAVAVCRRCGCELVRYQSKDLQRPLALACAGAVLFALFNAFPFLALKKAGLVHQTHLITGIYFLSQQGAHSLAALVALTVLLVPAAHLFALLYVLIPATFNRTLPGMFRVFRWVRTLQPWHMLEIFMLAVLVSLVKLAKLAEIVPGPAVYCLAAFIVVTAAANAGLDPHAVWALWKDPR